MISKKVYLCYGIMFKKSLSFFDNLHYHEYHSHFLTLVWDNYGGQLKNYRKKCIQILNKLLNEK